MKKGGKSTDTTGKQTNDKECDSDSDSDDSQNIDMEEDEDKLVPLRVRDPVRKDKYASCYPAHSCCYSLFVLHDI